MSTLNLILIGIMVVSSGTLGFGLGRLYELRVWEEITNDYARLLQDAYREEDRLRKELEEIV